MALCVIGWVFLSWLAQGKMPEWAANAKTRPMLESTGNSLITMLPDNPEGLLKQLRKPKPEEMSTCFPWLEKQIELIRPKALVALGATAIEGLLGETRPMNQLRGRWLN